MNRNRKLIYAFLALSFALSWSVALLFHLFGGRWYTPATIVIGVVYMFGPLASALIVTRFMAHEPIRSSLGISFTLNRWFVVSWLLPILISLAAFALSLAFPGIEYAPDMGGMLERFSSVLTPEQLETIRAQQGALPVHPFLIGIAQALVADPTVNALAAFGEEAGWRGFLQRRLEHLGFWRCSLLIGLVWGFWHAPIILMGHNYPHHPYAGVGMMVVFTVLLSPIFAYVRLRGRSVIAAAVAHGSLNASGGLAILLIRGGSELTTGITGLAGFIVLVVVNGALMGYHRLTGKPMPSMA